MFHGRFFKQSYDHTFYMQHTYLSQFLEIIKRRFIRDTSKIETRCTGFNTMYAASVIHYLYTIRGQWIGSLQVTRGDAPQEYAV